jgi:hypothetical protein
MQGFSVMVRNRAFFPMSIIKWLLVACAAFLSFSNIYAGDTVVHDNPTNAIPPRVDQIEIIESGLYNTETLEQVRDPTSATGIRRYVTATLKEPTTVIPAQLNTHFGVRYKVIGEPAGAFVDLKIIKKFPRLMRDPKRPIKDAKITSVFDTTVTIGDSNFSGYAFDHPYEILDGAWTWEIYYRDKKVAEKVLTVAKPKFK